MSSRGTPRRRVVAREHGLTLVELLVAVLLTSILVSGLFYMMSGQQATYTNQLRTLARKENASGAVEWLGRQLRMAGYGYGTCGSDVRFAAGVFDAGVSGSDAGGPYSPLRLLQVHNNTNLVTGASDGTDSLSILSADPSADAGGPSMLRIAQSMPIPAANTKVEGPASGIGIHKDDIVVLCDPGRTWASAIQVTKEPHYAGGRWHLVHARKSAYNPSGLKRSHFPRPDGYPAGSLVVRLGPSVTPRHIAIDNHRDPPLLVTWRASDRSDLEVIAAGIEDMQVAWGCDANGDGAIAEGACAETNGDGHCECGVGLDDCSAKLADEWAFNAPGDTPPSCGTAPIAVVRLTVIARDEGPELGDRRGYRPAAEDRARGTPSDDLAATGGTGTYSRIKLTTEVVPRNIR